MTLFRSSDLGPNRLAERSQVRRVTLSFDAATRGFVCTSEQPPPLWVVMGAETHEQTQNFAGRPVRARSVLRC
jgi:hypothetical protein